MLSDLCMSKRNKRSAIKASLFYFLYLSKRVIIKKEGRAINCDNYMKIDKFKFINKQILILILAVCCFSAIFLALSTKIIKEGSYFSPDFHRKEAVLGGDGQEVLPTNSKKELKLIFGGDVMLSRTVNAKMVNYQDYSWPFRLIASTTAAADITIFNLESPFLKNANYQVPSGSFSFRTNPLAIEGLLLSGVDVLSLANNHMLNAGQQGLIDTLDILEENNILAVGAGLDEKSAYDGKLISVDDWRVVFLAFAYPEDSSVALGSRPGIATLDNEKLEEKIDFWRPQADLIIVLMHAGQEYVSAPNQTQKSFAHRAIELGADAVIGHHPHWPQSWEIYNDRPIFYSLGNLVFDQMWSKETSQGLLLNLTFRADLSGQAELVPIIIKDYGQADLWPPDINEIVFWQGYELQKPSDIFWSNTNI